MTVQQQVADRIGNLSDEGAIFIEQVLNNMNPTFFVSSVQENKKVDVSKRFGAGKGIITNVDEFKNDNEEIAKMFEGFE